MLTVLQFCWAHSTDTDNTAVLLNKHHWHKQFCVSLVYALLLLQIQVVGRLAMQTEVFHAFPQSLLLNTSNNSKTASCSKLNDIHYYLTIYELYLKNMHVYFGTTACIICSPDTLSAVMSSLMVTVFFLRHFTAVIYIHFYFTFATV